MLCRDMNLDLQVIYDFVLFLVESKNKWTLKVVGTVRPDQSGFKVMCRNSTNKVSDLARSQRLIHCKICYLW